MNDTSLGTLLAEITRQLDDAGVLNPQLDASLLVAHVLGQSRGRVQAMMLVDTPISAEDATQVRILAARRARREPLQHITGTAAFRQLELAVGPGVFVPRPETEVLAEYAIEALRSVASPVPMAVDLGTGSGAIALALATEVPIARVWGVEKSAEAASWARRNFEAIRDQHPHATAFFVSGELGDSSVLSELNDRVDVVVSNPPYIPDEAVPRDEEVRLYDPPQALYGGQDGLDVVRQVSTTAMRLLRSGGVLLIEHGETQGRAVRQLLDEAGWMASTTHPDLTERDRLTTALRP